MRPVAHLANLDLNLLVALRELVRERSVTRAAQRLGVTQPAASASLSRLRRHFGDDLLVREHGEYVLTPLGEQLAGQVEAVCSAAERLFAASSAFDAATTEREFTLVMADYTIMVIGEALSHAVQRDAPRARLHIRLVRESLATEYSDGIRFVDGMVAPPSNGFALPDTRSAELFRDRWVCVLDGDNPVLDGGSALRIRDLAGLPWVAPYYRSGTRGVASVPVMRQLALLDLQPRIAVRVESYLAVPYFVTGTDRVALMQERLATRLAASVQPAGARVPRRSRADRRGAVVAPAARGRPGARLATAADHGDRARCKAALTIARSVRRDSARPAISRPAAGELYHDRAPRLCDRRTAELAKKHWSRAVHLAAINLVYRH